MDRYNPLKIEQKWQKIWADTQAFRVANPVVPASTTKTSSTPSDPAQPSRPTSPTSSNSTKSQPSSSQSSQCPQIPSPPPAKIFLAEMFPYPSGTGLHVGHVRNFSIVDALTRFYTQQQMHVLRPFGYDTFGLPAENFAIKTGTSPAVCTRQNIANFRTQLQKLGFAIDWSREINTSDPEYYRWTQWCFAKLYEQGLAYQKESYQWWCPHDQTVLANEQVEGGKCWRCGTEVQKKKMKQWFFRITAYAEELLAEIDALDWPEKIKTMQKNWIGRSEGATIHFQISDLSTTSKSQSTPSPDTASALSAPSKSTPPQDSSTPPNPTSPKTPPQDSSTHLKVFTTRPDTLFGVSCIILAPEHPLLDHIVTPSAREAVDNYCAAATKKSEIERQENHDKTGVFTGAHAINPINHEEIPIWVADYVLMGYGEGAIMAVPAHDERDFAFAQKFSLPIKKVIETPEHLPDNNLCYTGEGELVNSGAYNGLDSASAREQILQELQAQNLGHPTITYRMRDWLISRQRYWGCPIPIAYDKQGNPHLIPEDQLPVILPEITDYQPDSTGRSALAKAKDWLTVNINGEDMTRETDTLDGYACSSWYLWRYVSPHDDQNAWDPEAIKYWSPLDIYVGGDHAVAHLLYVRFWCKFFADQGLLPFREPIKTLLYNGYINAPDGKKMSKSKGNVIDPLEVINSGYGADTLRVYELFIGPYELDAAWDTQAIGGVYRFLNRCWTLCFEKLPATSPVSSTHPSAPDPNLRPRHQAIKKVTTDLHRHSFNTAVAALMEFVNHLYKSTPTPADITTLAKLLKPFAPHLAAEMLEHLGSDDVWPTWDESVLTPTSATVIVQINGKLRAKLDVKTSDLHRDTLITLAQSHPQVQKHLQDRPIKTIITPPGNKVINFVI